MATGTGTMATIRQQLHLLFMAGYERLEMESYYEDDETHWSMQPELTRRDGATADATFLNEQPVLGVGTLDALAWDIMEHYAESGHVVVDLVTGKSVMTEYVYVPEERPLHRDPCNDVVTFGG
jgi:hypothetical protein